MKSLPKAKRPKKAPIKQPLDLKERTRLIDLLNDPVMQKALGNVARHKPGVFFVGSGLEANATKDTAMATLMANNRLHQIQGWELFEAALFAQADDPKPAREKPTETFSQES